MNTKIIEKGSFFNLINNTPPHFNSYFISTLLQQIPRSIVKNHCEPLQILIWKCHVLCKKVSAFQKKNIKLRTEVAEDPPKHIFKVNFRFWVLSCIAIGKIVFFFSKSWDFFT